MTRVYAIGDVHGQLEELVRAHRRVAVDRRAWGDAEAPVVHLGDLVDRGPESAEVIEYLLMGLAAGEPWVTLRGNHDAMFLLFLNDPLARDPGLRPDLTWLDPRLGGRQTLASYGVDVSERLPPQAIADEARVRVPVGHQEFLEALPFFFETPDAIFVHAGLRPEVPLDRQLPIDLTWIRKGFLEDRADHGRLVVHGHTVVDVPEHRGNRVNIDTGAGYGRPLTAVVMEGRDVWVLTESGRVPLRPA